MKTLAEIYADNISKLKGRPSIVAMAHHFYSCQDMDKALGMAGATNKWLNLHHQPGVRSERAAMWWLRANRPLFAAGPEPDRNAVVKAPEPQPVQVPETLPTPEAKTTFMIVMPHEIAPKVERVLAMLGVEMIEI